MFVIAGPPGCGKSTQVECLVGQGYGSASAGELLRQQASPEILAHMTMGELVDMDYTNALIAQALTHLTNSHGDAKVIIDGFPRAVEQAQWLLEEYGANLEHYVLLMASEATLMERLSGRGRDDDKYLAIQKRLEIFRNNIGPLLEYLSSQEIEIHKINAEQASETIAGDIKRALHLA